MSMDYTAVAAPAPGYPLRLDIDYPEHLSRWLIFVKWLFGLPVVLVWALVYAVATLGSAAFFTILFRKKYPRWWFDAVVQYLAFSERVFAYWLLLLRDEYPALEDQQGIRLEVDYPEKLNRWLPLVKWLLAIPHLFVLYVLYVLAGVVLFIAWFAILFTGQFPRGLFDFVVGVNRWYLRVYAYSSLFLTDQYPPFSLK